MVAGAYLTVASLRLGAQEILVKPYELPEAYRVHGACAGITLLHPWANRLGPGEILVEGRSLELGADDETVWRDGNGLAIHGLRSRNGWGVVLTSPASCHAALDAPAVSGFPFSHRVEVSIELIGEDRLAVATTVSCAEDDAVPVAFGWHPYFRLDSEAPAELALPRRDHLELDSRGLPTGARHTEPAERLRTGGRALDDGYCGIAEGASLSLHRSRPDIEVTLTDGFSCAQVFAPLDAPVVSLEPMTAPTDALRSGEGLQFARPGAPFSARFVVRLTP